MFGHPHPYDLRRFGIVVPAYEKTIAYDVFESGQVVAVAAVTFSLGGDPEQ